MGVKGQQEVTAGKLSLGGYDLGPVWIITGHAFAIGGVVCHYRVE